MSWISKNPNQMDGLAAAAELMRKMAVNLGREQIDEDSCVAISFALDYILMAAMALGEANSASTLDHEIHQLLSEN